MANANASSRDEVLEVTWGFLDSLGKDREEIGYKLQVAVDVCKELAEVDVEAKSLCIALLAMARDFDECGPDPLEIDADGEIWVGLHPVSEVRTLAEVLGKEKVPMTEGQKMVWDALDGRILQGKELASKLDTSYETIRQHTSGMMKHGWPVLNIRSRGYYRADALPPEMKTTPA